MSWNTEGEDNFAKPGETGKFNEGSDTTVSHENENKDGDSWGQSSNDWSSPNGNENNRGRGRGRGRGARGRGGRNFNDNRNNDENVDDNAHEELFVRGIDYEATEDDLKEAFSKYGEIEKVKILIDKETKKSKGCGFVKFTDKKSAAQALNDADNLVCKGRNVLVKYSNDKEGEFKGKKGGRGKNDENSRNEGGRGRGRGGFRGGDRGRGRGGRGGRGRGGRDRNDNHDDNKKEDEDNGDQGWGSCNNKERSRSKEKDNEW